MNTRQAVAERRAAALKMRREGKQYAEIAQALNYASAGSASKDVSRALSGLVLESGRALLDLERERLDALQTILWPLVQAGDVRAAQQLIKLFERRARLLGLDRAAAERLQAEQALQSQQAAGLLGAWFQAQRDSLESPEHDDDK